jgi:hypothetical protein
MAPRFGLLGVLGVVSSLFYRSSHVDCGYICADFDAGIDMFIEYTSQNFDRKMVEFGCVGLDFEFKGRSEFYKRELPDMTMT